ncbi:MAG: GNAT family N-acetyltransferase [Pseudomonadota bacterium]
MTEVTIRKALPGDVAAMTELALRSKQSNGYSDAFMEACREELRVTEAALSEAEYWVAVDAEICGMAALGPEGEVHAFFIDPDRKRQGIGRLLWDALRLRAEALGHETLHLDADPEAVPFYEKLGFVVVGEAPSGSIPGRMLPRMERDLR